MPIKDYSTTAANNTLTPPNGAPEGMAAGLVNNTMRQLMADTRLFYESGGWCDLGHVPTFVSATSFTIPTDVTAYYTAGRRIRCFGTIMGTFYGYIVSSVFSSPNTTVTVILDSGALTSNLSRVDLSFFEQLATGISAAMQPVASASSVDVARSAMGIVGRNKIINGRMDLVQRGTNFPALAASTYCLDRYALQYTTTGVVTVSQQADVPSDNEFQSSLRVTVTTADTSIASADFMYLRQSIEGINVREFIGKPFTLSFRVRSSKTGVHCVAFRNAGFDRAFITEYTINNANTWETKSVTVAPGLITSGTWNWSNGIGLDVEFILMAGSLFHTTTGSWLSSSAALCTANQVNCLDTVGNIFAITGVQLESGTVATPFEHRLFPQEQIYAQRYCFSVYEGSTGDYIAVGQVQNSTLAQVTVALPVPMRGAVVFSGIVGGFNVWANQTQYNISSFSGGGGAPGTSSGRVQCVITGATAGQACHLRGSGGAGRLLFESEL